MRTNRIRVAAAATLAACTAAGCGGSGQAKIPSGVDGAVVFRDALRDNRNDWIDDPRAPFRNGRWDWNDVPAAGAELAPAKLPQGRVPDAISVSAYVVMRNGAALRSVACRDTGTTSYTGGYDLGIDGRRALIRRLKPGTPPRVLAAVSRPIRDGRRVQLTGRCVPDGKHGLALTLLVDGKVAAQAIDRKPGPPGGPGLHAFARPDTPAPPNLTWDTFVVRRRGAS